MQPLKEALSGQNVLHIGGIINGGPKQQLNYTFLFFSAEHQRISVAKKYFTWHLN